LLFVDVYMNFFNEETISFIGYSNLYVMLTAVVYYVGVPLALVSLFGSYRLFRDKSSIGLLMILGAYLPLLIMMLLTNFASTSNRYVFMALPCWVVLASVGAEELYNLAKQNVLFLAAFILPLAMFGLRDPLLEDVFFYINHNQIGIKIIGLVVMSCMLIIVSIALLAQRAKKIGLYFWGVVVLIPLLIHPIIMNSLYYAYQHGHRDNWKAASQVIHAHRIDGDPVVTYLPPLAEYYMGNPVLNIKAVDLDQVLQQHKRVWFVEDETFTFLSDIQFESWAQDMCVVMGQWDQFTGGRIWKLRLYMCSENQ
jgi:hypothetical protein